MQLMMKQTFPMQTRDLLQPELLAEQGANVGHELRGAFRRPRLSRPYR